jgi:hypothetical protein
MSNRNANRISRPQVAAVIAALAGVDTKASKWSSIEKLVKQKGVDVSRVTLAGVMKDFKIPLPEKKDGARGPYSNRLQILAAFVAELYTDLKGASLVPAALKALAECPTQRAEYRDHLQLLATFVGDLYRDLKGDLPASLKSLAQRTSLPAQAPPPQQTLLPG